jgi:hypothetical protein
MEDRMENSKIKMALKLEPIIHDDKREDNWLENNNAELMGCKSRVLRCNALHLRSAARGYELLIEQNAILLQDSDIIALPGIDLKASIVKEPMHDIWSNSKTQDPLDFLYGTQQGRAAAAPKHEGNILHELGINEASSTIVNKQYTSGKSSFLEQSPVDMLDEYLNFDEDE